jgi:N-methylhydantoinase A
LIAFGGAGPAYAAALARELGIAQVIVPVAPGLFSAVGLLASDPQHDTVRSYIRPTIDLDVVMNLVHEMEEEMISQLRTDGYAEDQITLTRFADMRYTGQKGVLRIPIPAGTLTRTSLESILDRLDEEHFRTYGHRKARQAASIVNLRVRALCVTQGMKPLQALALEERQGVRASGGSNGSRDAFFGPQFGLIKTPILSRISLRGATTQGPLIVEEMDSTTVVPPDAAVHLDELSNLVIQVG